MAQYQDGDHRFGMVRRNGVWVPDDQQSAAPQAPAPSPAAPQPWISAPREPPPQTADQAALDRYQAQAGAMDPEIRRGQASVVPYAAPKAAADTTTAQAQAEFARRKAKADAEKAEADAAAARAAAARGPQATEDQGKSVSWLTRAFGANKDYESIGLGAPGPVQDNLRLNHPWLSSQVPEAMGGTTPDWQRATAAQTEFINALLRRDTGATINDKESLDAYRLYFPQPGETDPSVMKQHAEARRRALQGLATTAGAALDGAPDAKRIKGWLAGGPQHGGAGSGDPLDPTGSGDIGFNQSAQGLPPQAQAAQRDLQAKILGGAFRSPEDFIGYAKKTYGFDINPEQAKAGIDAVRRGGAVQINTPQFAPKLSDARGTPQADEALKMQQMRMAGANIAGPLIAGIGSIAGPQKADAFAHGVGDIPTLGMSEELLSGFDPARLAQQNAIRDYDKQNSPYWRMGGQVLGGLAIPSGVAGAARGAGVDAIRAGGSRAEALLAATKAGSLRAGREGALYSGAYGVGSTDGGPLERLSGGAVDASIGAGTGYLGGRIFGGLFGRNGNRRATSAGAANLPPLVDPATGSLNQPLESANPAQRMAAARQYGIDLPLDSAGNKGSAIVGKGLDIMPASAGLMNDSRRATHGQTEDAVLNLANRYGAAGTMDAAGGALQTGAKNWIGRFDQVSSKAYDAIPIHPSASASLDNTRNALSGMLNVFQSNSKMKEIFQNGTLKSYLHALDEQPNIDSELGQTDPLAGVLRTLGRSTDAGAGELSWQDLKHFRSIIGEQIGDQRFSDSPLKSQMRGLYGALSEDMRTTAAARGPRALRAFERANSLYAQGQDRIEGALVRILGDNSKNNPEAAAAAIQTIARDGRGSSNIQQLTAIRNSLRKGNEWNEVASTLIRLGGQPANSQGREFDPSTFIRTYADMSEPARNLLFGDGGRQDLRKALDGFVAVTQRLNNTNALRNTSQTAPGFIGAGVVATVGQQLATTAAHPVQSLMTLLGTAGGAGVNYGMAKAWTNPKFVNWATGYTKLMASGRATPAAQDAWARRLGGIAKSEPAIANDVLSIQQRITDALGSTYSRAAASSQEEERRKRQQPY